jgi:hypothetical protein
LIVTKSLISTTWKAANKIIGGQQRKLAEWGVIAALVLAAIGISIWPATAAVVIQYFIADPSSTEVTLQWVTQSEYNVSGFELYCKRQDELDNAYHLIDAIPAEGGAQQGATYVYRVTQGLEPGVSYCFRLSEITTDGTPGELRELCGYGLGIAPTPTPSASITGTVASQATQEAFRITETAVAASNRATARANTDATLIALRATPTLSTTLTPTISLTITLTDGITEGQTIVESETPQPADATTPLSELDITLTAVIESSNATQTAQANLNGEQATPTPTQPGGESVLSSGQSTPTSTQPGGDSFLASPSETPTVDPAAVNGTVNETLVSEAPPTADIAQAIADLNNTPTPAYVVVTYTPTSEATRIPATISPWPTATATPEGLTLAAIMQPTTQNLTLMLLCLTFFTASGLGILGLLTSIVYMRSRRDNQPPSNRHRY